MSIFEQSLSRCDINHVALSPLGFIERTAHVYPDRIAIVHGDLSRTWRETYHRCCRLASALIRRGIGHGDTVAVMLPNIPPMIEVHFGVPMTGAVLNTINVRLDAEAIAFMLQHGEAKVLIADREFHREIESALSTLNRDLLLIDVDDPEYGEGQAISSLGYEELLDEGDSEFAWKSPQNEWDAISLNYTSGTTGDPKGVVYHHRGAYLNSLGNQVVWSMGQHPVYLWTLPMFHCNGWCFPWTVTAMAGTHVCLRRVDPQKILTLIREHQVSHLCGAPVVLNAIVNMLDSNKITLDAPLRAMVAGAAPSAKVIGMAEEMGIKVIHVYGLTEVYGPVAVCAWQEEWNELCLDERASIAARQGVRYPTLEGLLVADPKTLEPTPLDGKTVGEILMRGNTVMKGYLKNSTATEESFAGGWFHTGDLAVCHSDGYVEIRDRIKDVIISGGENISSIEIESTLCRHPAVLEAAVVARLDERWGETPCAFVTLKDGCAEIVAKDIVDFCRKHLAGFKVPRTVVFATLPKTATGKVLKNLLRQRANDL